MKRIAQLSLLALVVIGTLMSFASMLAWQFRWHGLKSIMCAIVYLALAIAFAYGFERVTRNVKWCREWVLEAISLIACISFSAYVGLCCGQHMVYDYGSAYRSLMAGKPCCVHPSNITYWCNYELLLSALGMMFPRCLLTGQVFNAVCVASIAFPVYRMVRRHASELAAIILALLFVTYPGIIAYSSMLSSEFVAVATLTYGIYYVAIAMDSERFCFGKVVVGVVFLAVSQLFKPIVPIFLAALLCCVLLDVKAIDRSRWMSPLKKVLVVLLLFVVGSQLLNGATGSMIASTNVNVGKANNDGYMWRWLAIGLSVESDGAWTPKISAMTNREAKEYLLERIHQEYTQYPKLMLKKFIRLYQSDNFAKNWVFDTSSVGKDGKAAFCIDVGYVAVSAFFALSVLIMLISCLRGNSVTMDLMSIMVTIVGFTMVIVVFEFQGRYRVSLYSLFFMLMAPGAQVLSRVVSGIVDKGKDNVV